MSKFFLEAKAEYSGCRMGEAIIFYVIASNLKSAKTKAKAWLINNEKGLEFPINDYEVYTINEYGLDTEDVKVINREWWG